MQEGAFFPQSRARRSSDPRSGVPGKSWGAPSPRRRVWLEATRARLALGFFAELLLCGSQGEITVTARRFSPGVKEERAFGGVVFVTENQL